ncbi:Protein 21.1 [Giardia duodenalis assemblage B]|uniref:Protein 21.1 n=1 Tax=Giardia duodenalis assemblage B TaxID=1394984 RepID=A0A132NVH0_GIAIN|nr:Protein 21.1 [Giardia intestinalis assemblage B]
MITSVQDWFIAIASGNESDVREFMGEYVGSRDETGDTALIIAARIGETEIVRLLSTTQEVGLINKEGCTALIAAAMSNKPDTCEILVTLEKHIPLRDGRDALMLAAFMANYEAVSVLVKHMALVEDDNQMNALDYAVVGGSLNVVKAIVESQESIDDKLEYAIFLATEPVREDILEYLKRFKSSSPSDHRQADAVNRSPVSHQSSNKLEEELRQVTEERDTIADELTTLNLHLGTLFTSVGLLRKKRLAASTAGSGFSSTLITGNSSTLQPQTGSEQSQLQDITTLPDALHELELLLTVPFASGPSDIYEEIEDQIKQLSRAVAELQDLNSAKDEEITELKRALESDIEGNVTETISQKDAQIETLQAIVKDQESRINKYALELEAAKNSEGNVSSLKAELKFKDKVINGLLSTIQKQEKSFSAIRSAFQQKEVETQKYRNAIGYSESTVKNLITANDYERARFSARNSLVINSPVRLSGAWGPMLSEDAIPATDRPTTISTNLRQTSIANNSSEETTKESNPASIASISRLCAVGSPSSGQRNSTRIRSGRLNMSEEERAELRKSIRMKMTENKMLKEALINASPSNTENKVLREEIDRLKDLLRASSPSREGRK